MMFLRSLFAASLIAATAVALSACGDRPGSVPPMTLNAASPLASPPKCKGQKTTEDYATLTKALKSSGGAFCIPAFGGFGGKLKYPNVSGSANLTLTSSVTNYNDQPSLGTGTPIFYIQFAISSGVSFGSDLKAGGGLTSATIESGYPYTLYGEAVVFGDKIKFGPCVTVATKGKYGGVIGGLGSLIKGRSVPFKASGVIEIYSGEQTTAQC
jgi:hypothetical protein